MLIFDQKILEVANSVVLFVVLPIFAHITLTEPLIFEFFRYLWHAL